MRFGFRFTCLNNENMKDDFPFPQDQHINPFKEMPEETVTTFLQKTDLVCS